MSQSDNRRLPDHSDVMSDTPVSNGTNELTPGSSRGSQSKSTTGNQSSVNGTAVTRRPNQQNKTPSADQRTDYDIVAKPALHAYADSMSRVSVSMVSLEKRMAHVLTGIQNHAKNCSTMVPPDQEAVIGVIDLKTITKKCATNL